MPRRLLGLSATSRVALALAVLGAPVWSAPRQACASQQGTSQTGSSNSGSSGSSNSNSSNGSNDSSNSSADSSKSSNGSSKDSNNSTQNSPKNSTDYTGKGSSDWSTNSPGAHVLSIALAVVVVGASVVGSVAASASRRASQQRAAVALAAFMRRQHALLTHDVATAEGPVLAAWAYDLGLAADEGRRLRAALEGSAEQGVLLDALDGAVDETRARRFAAAFMRTTERAIGKARVDALVARAALATGAR